MSFEYQTSYENEEDYEELNESNEPIQIGFITKDKVKNSVFYSKVGGKPIWLTPNKPAKRSEIACNICNKPMVLLLQLYTPEDEPASAYHRVLYVFICNDGDCLFRDRNKSFKVLRDQLPRDNPYYKLVSIDSDEEEIWELKDDIKITNQCKVCNLFADKVCSGCHKVTYCSKEHQIHDWTYNQHKLNCNNNQSDTTNNINSAIIHEKGLFFPELSLECEDEPLQDEQLIEEGLNNIQVKEGHYENSNNLALAPIGDEKYENTKVSVDNTFLAFQKRVELVPDQVLRYARTQYKGIDEIPFDSGILYLSEQNKPTLTDILPCQICFSNRLFEFQILPQLLNHLKLDHTSKRSLDWGSYMIFTCPNNCWSLNSENLDITESGFGCEVAIHQMFADDGMELKQQK